MLLKEEFALARKTKMNSINSPELLAQVNPKNKELLSDFLDYLKSVQRSETTIEAYRSDIEIAFVWCLQYNDNAFFCDWTKRNIVKFQNWLLNENENSPARVRRLKASLSSMANYIETVLDDEYPNFRNIIHKIESPPNNPVREKTVWSDEEIEHLLSELVKKERYNQACFVALAAYSGRRKAELCRFKVSDFDDDHLVCDGALYKSDLIKTKGRGAGKFINCYTLAKKFRPYLNLWIDERNKNGIDSDWLFPNTNNPNEHMSISTINSWTNSFSNITGKDFYTHSLRHFFTTSLIEAGIPEGVVQTIVNWQSADMVRLYTDTSAEDQIGMYFSGGDINVPSKKNFSEL